MKRNWVRVALWFLCLQKLLQSLEDILKTCHFSTFISSDVSETSIKVSILPSSPVPFHYLPLQDTEVQIVDIFERIQPESDHFPQPSFWAEFCCLMPHCSCNMWENPGKSIWLQFFSEDPCYRILLAHSLLSRWYQVASNRFRNNLAWVPDSHRYLKLARNKQKQQSLVISPNITKNGFANGVYLQYGHVMPFW